MTVEIRRASDRFVDREPGRATWHSLSFGEQYDAERTRFGPLVCHDEHLLGEGRGFEAHEHRDLEVVTWVVSGALHHTDSTGTDQVIAPGTVAVLSAGDGVTHAELAAAPQTRFVQAWLVPGPAGEEAGSAGEADPPAYVSTVLHLPPDTLVEAARPTAGATLSIARLDAGGSITVPRAPLVHVFVASGALARSSLAEPLHPGDAFEVTTAEGVDEPAYELVAAVPTELMVWAFV